LVAIGEKVAYYGIMTTTRTQEKTMKEITNEQIEILRSEAAQAGDTLQVALCALALANGLTDMVEVGEHRAELETLGIVPEHVDAHVKARELCAKAIADAQVKITLTEQWWTWHDEDYDRMYESMQEAEAACAAWVRGESDVGPERARSDRESCNDYECSERLVRWVKERRCCLDTDQGDDDRTIAAGLGNGTIQIPEWMGVREECGGVLIWDTAESSGDTHLVWLGADDEQ
jgi:hypothetical protein